MVQLFGFTMPLSALMFASDCDMCGFNDLGKLLFGGLLLALIIGVAVSLLLWRLKDKKPESAEFVSIRASEPRKSQR